MLTHMLLNVKANLFIVLISSREPNQVPRTLSQLGFIMVTVSYHLMSYNSLMCDQFSHTSGIWYGCDRLKAFPESTSLDPNFSDFL